MLDLSHSVRARLTAWYVIVTAVFLGVFGAAMYALLLGELQRRMDRSLITTAEAFVRTVNDEVNEDPPLASVDEFIADEASELMYADLRIGIFLPNGTMVDPPRAARTAAFRIPANTVRRMIVGGRSNLPAFMTIDDESDESLRVFLRPVRVREHDYIVAVARRLQDQAEFLEGLHVALLTGVPAWVACAGLLGYGLVRKTLQPVMTMSSEAAAISTADLTRRIPVENPNDELGRLAITFNALLDRLTAAFEQQRRFMADASHELRTPLAIVRGEAEVALSRVDRSAEDLRESLSVIEQESLLLSSVIDDLFVLARADAGQRVISPTTFYLDELIADAIRSVRSLALKKAIHIQSVLHADSTIEADERLLHRLVVNVIENAIKYTPPGGSVAVALRRDAGQYEITITDTGTGIAEGKQALIFERFYRERDDPAADGAGLGLAIARTIAELHGGAIVLESSGPEGSRFRISLPVQRATGA